MPFKSEAQRKYLWANEPGIARDWTDTYGSKIQAADGGRMRLGFEEGKGTGWAAQQILNKKQQELKNLQNLKAQQEEMNMDTTEIDQGIQSIENFIEGHVEEHDLEPVSGDKSKGTIEFDPNNVQISKEGMLPDFKGMWENIRTAGDKNLSDFDITSTMGVDTPQTQLTQGPMGDEMWATPNEGPHNFEYGNQWQQPEKEDENGNRWDWKRTLGSVLANKYFGSALAGPLTWGASLAGGIGNLRDRLRTVDGTIQPQSYWSEPARQQRRNQARVNNLIARNIQGKNIRSDALSFINRHGTLQQQQTWNQIQDQPSIDTRSKIVDDYGTSSGGNTSTSTQDDWSDTGGTGVSGFSDAGGWGSYIARGGMAKDAPHYRYAEGGRIGYQEGNRVGGGIMNVAGQGPEMEGAMMQSEEAIKKLYEALIAQGLSPEEAIEKVKQIIASTQTEEPQSPMMGEEFPGQEFSRAPAAFGGIMDTYTGRRKYGLGSFIKKAVKTVKKIAKSPIGKAALMYVATAGLGALGAGAAGRAAVPGQSWMRFLKPGAIKSTLGATKGNLFGYNALQQAKRGLPELAATKGKLGDWGLTKGYGKFMPTALGWGAAATAAPLVMGATGNWEQDQLAAGDMLGEEFDYNLGQARKDIASAVAGGDYNEFKNVLNKYDMTEGNQIGFWDTLAHGAEGGRAMAQGGRIGYAEGDYITRKPERGLGPVGRPAAGIRSLDMDMEWGGPENIEWSSARERGMDEYPLFASKIMKLEAEHERDVASSERRNLIEKVMKYIRAAGGSYKVPETSYWKALSAATEAGDEDVMEYLNNFYRKKIGRMDQPMGAAQGGRIGRQEGGLMNLGGMEKDYRNDGGFVPLGGEEKADDVPARLSRNEFVFTADAVRNAGGGDIDRGAEVMENVMKNLEAGGKVSEESQGEGAQEMFEVSERLSEVV